MVVSIQTGTMNGIQITVTVFFVLELGAKIWFLNTLLTESLVGRLEHHLVWMV